MSASSGSPYHTPSIHQPVPPLSHLREMLTTSVSDLEQSSDNHDVKDLSFRTNPPQQAPVITSSAASALHMDTSDYESTRSPTASFGNSSVSLAPTRITKAHINHHNTLNEPQNDGLCLVRTRKLSETSTDIEHCNNNYKFKNYIQQRFQQNEHYHSEESMTESSQCENDKDHDKKTLSSKVLDMSREDCSNKVKSNHSDIKNESTVTNSTQATQPTFLRNSKQNRNGAHHFPIPIFACHSQGFYVPLNVDYEGLIPYFDGVDVLSKTFQNLPPLHPIQIQCSYSNFNYAPTLSKTNLSSNNFIKPKVEALVNGW